MYSNPCASLRRLFHSEPYVTYFALSGAEGLKVLQQYSVDMVVSDMRMSEMNGAEFLAQVVLQWPETIRILLTGNADLQSTIDAINKGRIFSYCNKPWNDAEFKVLVRNALEQQRPNQEKMCYSAFISQRNKTLKQFNEQLQEKVGLGSVRLNNAIKDLELANKSLSKQYNRHLS